MKGADLIVGGVVCEGFLQPTSPVLCRQHTRIHPVPFGRMGKADRANRPREEAREAGGGERTS